MIGSLPRIRVSSSGMQPASLGVPGPRGEHQHRVVHGAQTLNQRLRRNGVAINHYVMAVGAQLVCQVIGKRIDIIEQQNVSHQKISFA